MSYGKDYSERNSHRDRKYSSNAEKQRAYRERKAALVEEMKKQKKISEIITKNVTKNIDTNILLELQKVLAKIQPKKSIYFNNPDREIIRQFMEMKL